MPHLPPVKYDAILPAGGRIDPAFAADDASWDATFAEHAAIVREAQALLDART